MKLRQFLLIPLSAAMAFAQAVITLPGGQVSLGIAARGQLGAGSLPSGSNAPGSSFGIYLVGPRLDAIAPGCFCEGWGASANGIPGHATNDNGDNGAILPVSFSSTASSATAVTTLAGTTLQITQAYGPAASSGAAAGVLFVNNVTLTNTGGTALTDVRYTRSMDWDIPPTSFSEFVTIQGWPASALLFSSDDGFADANPLVNPPPIMPGVPASANFVKIGPDDHGAFFTFGFGTIGPGESKTFRMYYGAGANEAEVLAALPAAAVEVFSLGYSGTGTPSAANANAPVWVFGFAGVGGTPAAPGTPTAIPTLSGWVLAALAALLAAAAAFSVRRAPSQA
jgi:type IV pilus assembly protein PilY1